MFLPMSWTSPLTVAIRILPAVLRSPLSMPLAALASFSASMYGSSPATACFMTRADFTTCGRNILPAPNRSPTTFMPAISGPSMTCSGRSASSRASSVSASMNSVMPLTSAWLMRCSTGHSRQARSRSLGFLAGRALEALGDLQHALGRRAAGLRHAVEHDILAGLAQLRVDRFVDGELAGIDDAHVHAALDGMVEEHRVHGLAHRLVAAEREGQVGDAARDMDMRQRRGDLAGRLDEVDAVIVVLLDAGGDGEDVRIEDDVFRREAGLFGQELVGARADLDLARPGVGLPCLVEGHDDDGRAIGAARASHDAGKPPRLPSSRSN